MTAARAFGAALYGDGDGGAGGKGGRMTGTMTTIVANTSGDDAYGVLLESLGGDGGTGAERRLGAVPATPSIS